MRFGVKRKLGGWRDSEEFVVDFWVFEWSFGEEIIVILGVFIEC